MDNQFKRRPFVGRDTEKAAIQQAVADAAAGQGSVVLVHGEAGIGKTSTVTEALRGVPRDRILWGRCPDTTGAPAFWPWTMALRRRFEQTDASVVRAET